MTSSLFWKIILPFMAVVLLGVGVLGIFMVNSSRDTQIAHLQEYMTKEAYRSAEASILSFLNQPGHEDLDTLAKRMGREIGAGITFIAEDGTVLGDTIEDPSIMENHSSKPEVLSALASGLGVSTRYSDTTRETSMYVAVPVIHQGAELGVARISLPTTVVAESINQSIMTVIWVLVITGGLTIFAAAVITRMITRPLRRFTRSAQRIASGQFDEAAPVSSSDELGQLGKAFNNMTLNLETTMNNLSGERAKLAGLLSGIADGVVMTDGEGRLALANPAAESLFGFDSGKVAGRPLIEVIPDHEIDELIKKCRTNPGSQSIQLDSAKGRFLHVIAVPLMEARLRGVLLLFQDLTEMRNLQTMRREFVGNVSHELRTPLSAIKAIVDTLQDGAIEDRPVAADFLVKIQTEVDGMTQMVNELIALSRIETGRVKLDPAPVNINEIICEVIEHLRPQAERQDLELTSSLAPDIPLVQGERSHLEQVLINILHNAVKFTPPKGKILVSSQFESGKVIVTVSDSGIGIAHENLLHIFERFFKADKSRSTSGSGLGLAIAKHIIQAHGGQIWVRSKEGKGSTFGFSLPVSGIQ